MQNIICDRSCLDPLSLLCPFVLIKNTWSHSVDRPIRRRTSSSITGGSGGGGSSGGSRGGGGGRGRSFGCSCVVDSCCCGHWCGEGCRWTEKGVTPSLNSKTLSLPTFAEHAGQMLLNNHSIQQSYIASITV